MKAHGELDPARLTLAQWRRLALYYSFIVVLHVLGFGALAYYSERYAALTGLGLAAYLFGLRHAFDADHIAAIDDTVRYLIQRGQRPLGAGFFFSLGHSTVVFVLALALALAASWVKRQLPALEEVGAVLGAAVSGAFLWLIGILNLLVILDILRIFRASRRRAHGHAHLQRLLAQRGLLNRVFGGRIQRLIKASWQMYPLGLLFGLGFDTASEVALLAMTAGAAAGNLPIVAVLALPILFAAGMCLMDTSDGVLMCKAYHWALENPLRKLAYNLTTTGLSVAVALGIGTIELLQVLIRVLGLDGPAAHRISEVDLGNLGFWIVGGFLFAWGLSYGLWRMRRPLAPGQSLPGISD